MTHCLNDTNDETPDKVITTHRMSTFIALMTHQENDTTQNTFTVLNDETPGKKMIIE